MQFPFSSALSRSLVLVPNCLEFQLEFPGFGTAMMAQVTCLLSWGGFLVALSCIRLPGLCAGMPRIGEELPTIGVHWPYSSEVSAWLQGFPRFIWLLVALSGYLRFLWFGIDSHPGLMLSSLELVLIWYGTSDSPGVNWLVVWRYWAAWIWRFLQLLSCLDLVLGCSWVVFI